MTIIRKTRAEALKEAPSSRKTVREENEDDSPRRRMNTTGRPHQSSGNSNKKQLQPGESYADFFAREK